MGAAGITSACAEPNTGAGKTGNSGDIFNVKDFGAKGDGKTPDSGAIQKAVDAAGKALGTVFFPMGNYRCHDIKMHPHIKLMGDPKWGYSGIAPSTALILDSEDASCIVNATGAENAHVCGLTFFGNRKSLKTKKPVHGLMCDRGDGPFAKDCETVTIEDCKFSYMSGHGVYLNKIFVFIMRRCLCAQNGGSGTFFYGWDGYVCDNIFAGNVEHGFGGFTRASSMMFTHNRVEWNGKYGVYAGPAGTAWGIIGNAFDHNWGAGVGLDGVQNCAVTGNTFRRNGRDAKNCVEGAETAHIAILNAKGICVSGNSFLAIHSDGGKGAHTPDYGVWMKGAAYCNVTSNNMFNGYMKEAFKDAGGNSENLLKDNIATARKA